MKYKVGIIGCGGILPRHIEAIKSNIEFTLISVCDISEPLVQNIGERFGVSYYTNYQTMIQNEKLNFIIVATPNSLHKSQSLFALENGCDVLIEKPVSFNLNDAQEIYKKATKNKRKAYCVLQVRLNPTVKLMKVVMDSGLLGKIRGFSFTQRWQRPHEYFSGWRNEPKIGGGILYETGIHYLDVLQYLIGPPKEIFATKLYMTKHKTKIMEDTVYSLLDYGDFGGTIESTISSEPKNLESSISLLGSHGYIKMGGKALNIIESASFLGHGHWLEYKNLARKYIKDENLPNNYGSYQGSCPNHPELFSSLSSFTIDESFNVIDMIEKIYSKANILYGK